MLKDPVFLYSQVGSLPTIRQVGVLISLLKVVVFLGLKTAELYEVEVCHFYDSKPYFMEKAKLFLMGLPVE